jgi:hypothetical protein
MTDGTTKMTPALTEDDQAYIEGLFVEAMDSAQESMMQVSGATLDHIEAMARELEGYSLAIRMRLQATRRA